MAAKRHTAPHSFEKAGEFKNYSTDNEMGSTPPVTPVTQHAPSDRCNFIAFSMEFERSQ